MARTLESKGVVIAGAAVIAICVAVNLWLWLCPPFGGTADTGSAVEQAQAADAGSSKSASGSEEADAADDVDGTDGEADADQSSGDVPNGETVSDYTEGLSADSSTAVDPEAQLDPATVPVPAGVDAEAFRAAVAEFANGAGIGCIHDVTLASGTASSANGYSWWDLEGTIGDAETDTYLRVYLEPTGTFSVIRR